MVTSTDTSHGSSSDAREPALLHGTPVVPGVAYGPALVARTEVSPDAIAAFDGSALDEEAALTAFDSAVGTVADGFARKAEVASGAAAEVLTASAGLARDKGLRGAVRKQLRSGEDLLAALHAAVEQFVSVFTGMGGLMAERVTDLLDIERRVTARLVGEPEPGVPAPREPSVLVAEDLAPADTAGPVETDPDEALAEERVRADREARVALASWSGPGATADGTRVKILANVADGESARSSAAAPVEGVGLFRTELCFLNRKEEP